METGPTYRPRVPRETQRLLVTALIALTTLWILSRWRDPAPPDSPSPLPSFFNAFERVPSFDDLAFEVARLQNRVRPLLVSIAFADGQAGTANWPSAGLLALRIGADVAIACLPPQPEVPALVGARVEAADPVSGLTVLRLDSPAPSPIALPPFWTADSQPQFFMVASPSETPPSLRPVFVPALSPLRSVPWQESVWSLPANASIPHGSIVFTTDGQLVGIALDEDRLQAVVPARALVERSNQLLTEPATTSVTLGVEVHALDTALERALGIESGVVVSWVDRTGPARSALQPGDVVESLDGEPVSSLVEWRAAWAGRAAGTPVALGIWRAGAREVVHATPLGSPGRTPRSLGLIARLVAGVGSEVVTVGSGSAAADSGLTGGDVIVSAGSISAPSPAQLTSAFSNTPDGSVLLITVARSGVHRVLALRK
ncbi:MAG: PDZ domain-containing protein [Vicinamibacterales bacterium]